jgi:hypothetical protein
MSVSFCVSKMWHLRLFYLFNTILVTINHYQYNDSFDYGHSSIYAFRRNPISFTTFVPIAEISINTDVSLSRHAPFGSFAIHLSDPALTYDVCDSCWATATSTPRRHTYCSKVWICEKDVIKKSFSAACPLPLFWRWAYERVTGKAPALYSYYIANVGGGQTKDGSQIGERWQWERRNRKPENVNPGCEKEMAIRRCGHAI